MSYTEIPTDLLLQVHDLVIGQIMHAHDAAGNDRVWELKPVTIELDDDEMAALQPLVQWLRYIVAVWAVEGERERRKRFGVRPR